MDAHTEADGRSLRPGRLPNCLLGSDGGGYRVFGSLESEEEGVSLAVYFLTAPLLESAAKKPPMLSQDIGVPVTQFLEQARGPLDVSKKEGDRPGRQAGHARPSPLRIHGPPDRLGEYGVVYASPKPAGSFAELLLPPRRHPGSRCPPQREPSTRARSITAPATLRASSNPAATSLR